MNKDKQARINALNEVLSKNEGKSEVKFLLRATGIKLGTLQFIGNPVKSEVSRPQQEEEKE